METVVTRLINFFSFEPFASRSLSLNKAAQIALDALALGTALFCAYLLRFEFQPGAADWQRFLFQLPILIPYQLTALYFFGVYRQIWRYTSLPEAKTLFQAIWAAALPLVALRVLLFELFAVGSISLSIIILDAALASGALLGLRVLRRIIYEQFQKNSTLVVVNKKPVFLIGAGRAGVKMLAEIKARGDFELEVIGFLDDDPLKRGAVINGVPVVGTINDLPLLAKEFPLDHVIVSIASASPETLKRIVSVCESIPLKARTIPGMHEVLQEKVTVSRVRDIQIEDLLCRPAVELDSRPIETFIKNKRVMVTGAGGSIGSELVRQLLRYSPESIILVERSEYALFLIERELAELPIKVEIKPIIADVGDRERMASVFRRHRPEVVFHAAAHKHVPLMEANVAEAAKNNVLGTEAVADLAGRFGAEAFVLISTDKAVNPTSVMGATKRVAELIVQNLNQKYETRFLAVRFGNVIGSTGSVTTIFREQIRRGGPVTVTDREMERYFMTISEAVSLVLQAGAIGAGGEIFILDMGEPVKILELAEKAILLAGLKPGVDIKIAFTGARPGEKLFEELQTDLEKLAKTRHPKIFIGKIAPYPPAQVAEMLKTINDLCQREEDEKIRRFLSCSLPEASLSCGLFAAEEADTKKREELLPPEQVASSLQPAFPASV